MRTFLLQREPAPPRPVLVPVPFPVFRARLNDLRDLPVWYISPSNWYDWQFLRLTWRPYDRANLHAAWAKEWNAPQTLDAGALAYTAEVMVVVCTVIWMT